MRLAGDEIMGLLTIFHPISCHKVASSNSGLAKRAARFAGRSLRSRSLRAGAGGMCLAGFSVVANIHAILAETVHFFA